MGRLEEIKNRYHKKIENRVSKINAADYHPVFENISDMEVGEEIRDDIWIIIRIPQGWIVKGANIGTVFVPATGSSIISKFL
jgi:hypothetical protein